MPALSKPRLSELQRWMRWVLTYPGGVAEAVRPKPALPKHWTRGRRPKAWLEVIGETAEVPRVDRLRIYGGGYFGRLVECMGAIFEGVHNVVGDDDFYDLAKAYLVRYPSRFKCIDNIGYRFVDFVRGHALTRKYPFLPDLAEVENMFHQSFYSDDLPAMKVAEFAALRPEALMSARLKIDPAVRLLDLAWPVDDLWRADGRWPKERLAKLKRQRIRLLMYRLDDKTVRAPRVDRAEFDLMKRLLDGKTVGAALRATRGLTPDRVQRLFANWVSLGLIRGLARP